jgi:low affinity Fe/Cu permease
MAKAARRKNVEATKPESLARRVHNYFSHFAQQTSHAAGQPIAFFLAALVVLAWAISGPIFGYSDTWQLFINTGTTIATFLMVFLIQNTQNRDTLAFHLKLSELVFAVKGAKNQYAALETLEDKELEALHDEFCRRVEHMRETLEARRGAAKQAAARTTFQVKKSRRNGRRGRPRKNP